MIVNLKYPSINLTKDHLDWCNKVRGWRIGYSWFVLDTGLLWSIAVCHDLQILWTYFSHNMADDAVIGYVMEKVIMADSLIGHSSFSLSLYKMRLYFMVSQKDGFPIP